MSAILKSIWEKTEKHSGFLRSFALTQVKIFALKQQKISATVHKIVNSWLRI